MNGHDEEYRPKWENRRRVLFATLTFCASVILYILLAGEDTRINETIVSYAFMTGGACVASYVFGAAWENIKISANKEAR